MTRNQLFLIDLKAEKMYLYKSKQLYLIQKYQSTKHEKYFRKKIMNNKTPRNNNLDNIQKFYSTIFYPIYRLNFYTHY